MRRARALERAAQLVKGGGVECFAWIRLDELLDGESGCLDGVLGHLHQVAVERDALLGLRGMLDRECATLGSAQVVGERERDVLANLTQPTRDHADAVK